MALFTQAVAQTLLDTEFPTSGSGDYIAWSADGSTESTALARTQVGATGWAAATAAQPPVKANSAALTTAAATAAVASPGIGYWAVFSASTGGTQKTVWLPLTAAKVLAIGDKLTAAIGALTMSMQ